MLELPGCGAVTAAKLLAEISLTGRFTSDAQRARHSGVAAVALFGCAVTAATSTPNWVPIAFGIAGALVSV